MMSDIVAGLANQIWVIEGYDSTTSIMKKRIPLTDANEGAIRQILHELACQHLNASEIAAGLADVRKDDIGGKRIALMAGQNPHYIAGLWRADELAEKEK